MVSTEDYKVMVCSIAYTGVAAFDYTKPWSCFLIHHGHDVGAAYTAHLLLHHIGC